MSRAGTDRKRDLATQPLAAQDFRRILLIKPSSLGDVARTLPILAGLRQRYPEAHISWMLRPDCAELVRGAAGLDDIIDFDRRRFGKMYYHWAAARDFRRFAWASGAAVRVGFDNARECAGIFYTHKIRAGATPEHVVESNWRFAEFLGFGRGEKVFAVPIPNSARREVETLVGEEALSRAGGYAVLLAGGTASAKCWPPEQFGVLAARLRLTYDMGVVLLGTGQQEQAIAAQVAERAEHGVVNLVGKTSLKEAAAVLERARVVVGNDSGPLHIGAALAVPTVGLYGPTNPLVVGPYGQMDGVVEAGAQVERDRRYSRRAEHQMSNIGVEDVLQAIERKLSR